MWGTCCKWWISPGWTLLDHILSAIILFWCGHFVVVFLPIGPQSICSTVSMWSSSSLYYLYSPLPPFFVFIVSLLLFSLLFLFSFVQLHLCSCSLLFELHSINILVLSSYEQWNFPAVSNWSLNITEVIFCPLFEEVFSIFSQKNSIFWHLHIIILSLWDKPPTNTRSLVFLGGLSHK